MNSMRLLFATAAVTTASLCAAALTFATPQVAEACGGTFCDAGPMNTPVDQTGENILFVIDGAQVEAHIQIQYDPETDADKFAWVIPVLEVPEFEVGSDPLFQALLGSTVPSYGLNNQTEFCGGGDDGFDNDGGAGDPSGTAGGTTGAGESDSDGGGPTEVVAEQTLGAFEIVVLQSTDVMDLMQWLGDNGYQQDPAAEPIFQEYLEENYLFAAFKLTTSAEVDQIHPVVLKFNTGEACIPIRLTRIAAQEDMEVRTFFLGNTRTVPRNYRHVLVNPLKIDWLNLGNVAENYKDVITQAVDAFEANGHAFVTEYAGQTNVIDPFMQQFNVYQASWNAAPFATAEAVDAPSLLQGQGLMDCFPGQFCNYMHPLLQGLLAQYLPVPDGLEDSDFYANPEAYADLINLDAWDAQAFSDAMQQRIVDPAAHAQDLVQTWPYLTRMYTTISPGEMTEDPFFQQNPNLEDVANIRRATRTNLCSGDSVVTLPDGREIFIPQDPGTWPEFPNELPWEAEVQTIALQGAPMTLVDNNEIIDQAINDWNLANNWPPEDPGTPGVDTQGGEDSGTDSGSGGGEGEGCGCTVDSGKGGLALTILLGVLGLGVRRRRD